MMPFMSSLAIEKKVGAIDEILPTRFCKPERISSTPPLPLKTFDRPVMTWLIPGRNWLIMLRLTPSRAVVMSVKLSWNAAESLTASSDMTPPKS